MVQNRLVDLNNHLFEQLERLNDSELVGDALVEEIERTKAVTMVASQIVSVGRLVVEAKKTSEEYGSKSGMTMLLNDGKDNGQEVD